MESDKFLEQLFDKKMLLIIRYFLKNKAQAFYVREVAKATRVPLASTFRILQRLVRLEILGKQQLKTAKLYRWKDNEQTKYLAFILEQKQTVLDSVVESMGRIPGIQAIILYGEADKESVMLLLIGSQIPEEQVRAQVVKAKEENNFTIKHLTLSPDQFNQMSSMGLYPKQKKILFEQRPA